MGRADVIGTPLSSLHLLLLLPLALSGLFGCATAPRDFGRTGLFDRVIEASRHRVSRGPRPTRFTDTEKARIGRLTKDWSRPLEEASVTSEFGPRDGRLHEGIDLKARTGTRVYASAPGRVLYASARIKGYGRMVVIDHGNHLATVYAHLSRIGVKEGQGVRKGQLIGKSGASGRASGPHLHFELRYGTAAVDPERLATTRFHPDIPPPSSAPPQRTLASPSKKKKPGRG